MQLQSRERVLLGVHIPDANASDPALKEAVRRCVQSTAQLRSWDCKILEVYACGSACIVFDADRSAAEQSGVAPQLHLQLANKTFKTDGWFEFTAAMSDDVDHAYAEGTPWHCAGGDPIQVPISDDDVDKVFCLLPHQCTARVRREQRRCKNRCSRGDRCYCHGDRDKYPDWAGAAVVP